MKNPLTIVVLGRSGSGKGEQVKRLEKKLKPVLAIHTGARFRALARKKTPAARITREFLARGNLAPTWLAEHMWIDALMRDITPKKNIIFDGSPRMKGEAELLDHVLGWFGRHNLVALYVDVGEKEVTRRLLLRGRGDDRAAAIRNRLAFFKKNVLPSIQYYKNTKRLIRINGEQSIDAVFGDICKALKLK
jgi:adenylate kinase